jgi:hypothetical protein
MLKRLEQWLMMPLSRERHSSSIQALAAKQGTLDGNLTDTGTARMRALGAWILLITKFDANEHVLRRRDGTDEGREWERREDFMSSSRHKTRRGAKDCVGPFC